MNVVVGGLMTHYLKTGSGKKVLVLLHGWGDSAQSFAKLAAEFEGYTVYALDLPGFGQTQRPREAWELKDYAGFVADWLEKAGIDSYSLAGHSFGGAVVIKGVAEGQLTPDKLILLASAGIRNKRPLRLKTLQAGAKVAKIPLYILPPSKARKIKTKLYRRIGSDVLLIPAMRQTFAKTVREDLRQTAGRISIPTLLIYADRDRETPISDGLELQAAIKGSSLEIVRSSGHFLHQDRPQQVAELMQRFLKVEADV